MNGVLFKIAVFLLAAILTVPVAKFLRLGSVLGYLIAGVVIGPYMLGFLGLGDQATLLHITEFGVVMMLFIIGLEVKPSFLWRLRVPILGMGGLQMFLSALALAATGRLLGLSWSSALAIGMILGLSSTAIIIQTLSEKGLLGGRVGRSSFSVLLFQDIAVIPILALLPLLSAGGVVVDKAQAGGWLVQQPAYVQFAAIICAMAVVIVGGHFVSGKIFRLIAATEMRDIFTATALFLVVSVALLMEAVGLSAALGTFLAGVMLADSEYRHEIELSIEPFKGLLLGMFFISVGAGMDFHLFRQHFSLILSLVAIFIVVKWLVLFLLALLFQHSRRQALLFAVLMAQGGEFAFVLFSFSKQNHILPASLADMLVLVVTLSMLFTPLMLLLFERVEALFGEKKPVEPKDDEAFEPSASVIIVGYGRFSQTIGRLLQANGEHCTILDNNPQLIEVLKRFGQKVYYGDATRPDLLEAAGAKTAKVLVIGLRNPDQTDELIHTVRKHFPQLKIIARAFDRVHAYRLIQAKVNHFQREHFNSALELGEKTLIELGYHPYNAHRQVRLFKQHDEKMILDLAAIWNKDPNTDLKQRSTGEQYISHMREMTASIEDVLRSDRYSRSLRIESDHAWELPPQESFNKINPKIDE